MSWVDCGAGGHQSDCRRFYIQTHRRYAGRVAGRPTYDAYAILLDRSTGEEKQYEGLRAAKQAAEQVTA